MKRIMICIVFTILLGNFVLAENKETSEADAIIGKWYTGGATSQVEIRREGDKYLGKIVWLKEPLYAEDHNEAGQPKKDTNNPDVKKQHDPIVGVELIKNFAYDRGSKKWVNGSIYNPEDGKTYNCYMHFNEQDDLFVRGSLDPWGVVGKTQIWKRVSNQ